MAATRVDSLIELVAAAVAGVDDPELPGISIVELGLVETLDVDRAGHVAIGLIPTFSGCPALAAIRDDVARAVTAVPGVASVHVGFLPSPAWTIERVAERARRRLADSLGVAVDVSGRSPACPRCGGATSQTSMFGPTRCRAVHRCTACGEVVEVMRG